MLDFNKSDVGFLQVGCRILVGRMAYFYKSDVGCRMVPIRNPLKINGTPCFEIIENFSTTSVIFRLMRDHVKQPFPRDLKSRQIFNWFFFSFFPATGSRIDHWIQIP